MDARLPALLAAVVVVACSCPALGEWPHDPVENNPVCVLAASDQDECVTAEDGSEGAFIIWVDDRNGNDDIYAQHIDEDGVPLWPVNGIVVCDSLADQNELVAALDGQGGVLIAWTDARGGDTDIYAQRLDADGVERWASGGRAVSTAVGDQSKPAIVASEGGGAILAWLDFRSPPNYSVYAQRVSGVGALGWAPIGVRVGGSTTLTHPPGLVWDDAFGVFVAWKSGPDVVNYEIRLQRLDAAGTVLWAADGYEVSSNLGVSVPKIVKDGDDGVITVWSSTSLSVNNYVSAARVTGDTLKLWSVSVRTNEPGQNTGSLRAVTDGSGGVIVAWTDNRNGNYDVYAQRVDGGGNELWLTEGAVVCDNSGAQSGLSLVADGAGGAIVAWEDDRFGFSDIYAQRLDSIGGMEWTDDGAGLSSAPLDQLSPSLVICGEGNAIAAWADGRTGDSDVHAQRVERNGFLGDPAPGITDAVDFPTDQGGLVVLSWAPSYLDEWPESTVDRYHIWRRLNDGGRSGRSMPSLRELEDGIAQALGRHGWEFVAYVDAAQLEEYASTVPTYGDSTASGIVFTDLMVWAEDYYTDDYWMSDPVTTYSIDNIHPGAPLALAAEELQLDVGLTWSPSRLFDEDLSHYNVHRSDVSGFEPDETTLVGTTTDTFYLDIDPGRAIVYYVVTAEDIHGNVGPPSNEAYADTWAGTDDEIPESFALRAARPNPFNPFTTIAYDVPEPGGHVTLEVYDVAGRLVRTLIGGHEDPGHRHAVWRGEDDSGKRVSSGVYLCRMVANDYDETIKLTLLK